MILSGVSGFLDKYAAGPAIAGLFSTTHIVIHRLPPFGRIQAAYPGADWDFFISPASPNGLQ
jgi:hypothetical protein